MDISTDILVLVGVAVAAGLVSAVAGIGNKLAAADRRAARVEQKLDLILDHLGLTAPEPWRDEVTRLLRAGKKIEAIKTYREATGAGLKESKEAVERLG